MDGSEASHIISCHLNGRKPSPQRRRRKLRTRLPRGLDNLRNGMLDRVTIDFGLGRSGSRSEGVCNLSNNGRLGSDGGRLETDEGRLRPGERLRGRSTAADRRNLPYIMAVAEGRETAGVAVSGCVTAVAVGAAAGSFRRAVAGEAGRAAAW